MKSIILLPLLLLIPIHLVLADNLSNKNYIGKWESNWVSDNNEKHFLEINSDMSSIFKRHIKNRKNQILKSKPETYILSGRIMIFEYYNNDNQLIKLLCPINDFDIKDKMNCSLYFYNKDTIINKIKTIYIREIANKAI